MDLKMLLASDAEQLEASTGDGDTPMMTAATQGHLSIVQILCKQFMADVDVQDQYGDTALHRAAGHFEIVEVLIDCGASVHATNRHNDTPLHCAAWFGNVRVMRLLLANRASVDAVGHLGERPLAVAARRNQLDAVRFLLERGRALVSNTDGRGRTALHAAAEAGAAAVCECLLFFNAQPTTEVTECLQASARRAAEQKEAEAREQPKLTAGASFDAAPLSAGWVSRIRRMPPYVRHLLGYNMEPETVWPLGLLLEQTGGTAIDSLTKFRNAMHALERPSEDAVMRVKAALTPEACEQLRRAVDSFGAVTMDSVDAMPNVDVPMPVEALEKLIGKEPTKRLLALPQRYVDECASSDVGDIDDGNGHSHPGRHRRRRVALAGSFARRYMADARGQEQPLTSFHFDSAAVTVNVALSDDDAVSGGRLLGVFGGAVQCIERQAGDASVHSSSLLHGVSRIRSGTRYSLICFFGFVA